MPGEPVAGGGHLLQVIFEVAGVVGSLLWVAVLHHQNAAPVAGGREQRPHHGLWWELAEDGGGGRGLPRRQVATAALGTGELRMRAAHAHAHAHTHTHTHAHTQTHAAHAESAAPAATATTVVVVDAARGWAPEFVVVLEVFREVDEVGGGGGAAQRAQLVVRRLEHLLEHGGVEVLAPQDVLLARLLDLHHHGHDEQDEHHAARHADDRAVSVVQIVQDVCFPLLCTDTNKRISIQFITLITNTLYNMVRNSHTVNIKLHRL